MKDDQRWLCENEELRKRNDNLSIEEYEQICLFLERKWFYLEKCFLSALPKMIPNNLLNNETVLEFLNKAKLILWNSGYWDFPFRIHKEQGVYISTDFPTTKPINDDRVFPWIDESQLLLKHISKIEFDVPPHRILNLCCGAGTIALVLAKKWPSSEVIGIDNNERAILCADFNKNLNNIKNLRFKYSEKLFGDLRESDYDLIVADPPFAIQPPWHQEYSHSAGGEYGELVVKPLITDVSKYLRAKGRFLMLSYSLGDEGAPLRIIDLIKRHLCTSDGQPSDKYILLKGEKIWRFHGEKRVNMNPMPVRYMAIRCGDNDYKILEKEHGLEDYIKWIEENLIGHNPSYTHLHYLIVDHTSK